MKNLLKTFAVSSMAVAAFAVYAVPASAEDGDKARGFGLWGGTSVTIGGEGRTLVRGAEVTAVNEGSFTAETEHGDTVLTWTIDTDSDTEYVGQGGNSAERDDIEEGDVVSFSGMLESSFTVAADVVREWVHDLGDIAFAGTIDDKDDDSFTLNHDKSGKRDVLVQVDGSTDVTIDGEDADYADLDEGMRVKVVGAYDEDTNTLEASAIVAGSAKKDNDDRGPWRPFVDFWGKMKAHFGR